MYLNNQKKSIYSYFHIIYLHFFYLTHLPNLIYEYFCIFMFNIFNINLVGNSTPYIICGSINYLFVFSVHALSKFSVGCKTHNACINTKITYKTYRSTFFTTQWRIYILGWQISPFRIVFRNDTYHAFKFNSPIIVTTESLYIRGPLDIPTVQQSVIHFLILNIYSGCL